jgi:hypothetical protein
LAIFRQKNNHWLEGERNKDKQTNTQNLLGPSILCFPFHLFCVVFLFESSLPGLLR